MQVMLIIITIITFVVLCHFASGQAKDILTKDYLIYPISKPLPQFVQLPINSDGNRSSSSSPSFHRPDTSSPISVVKTKHLNWKIYLYWFTQQNLGVFWLNKISRLDGEYEMFSDATPIRTVILDLDINPTNDLIYIASDNGIVEFNTTSSTNKQLLRGTVNILKLDHFNESLYYVNCSNSTKPVLGKYNLSSNSLIEIIDLDQCYSKFDIDFENGKIYFSNGPNLSKTSLRSLNNSDLIKTFDGNISSMALGRDSLYLVVQNGDTIYRISRSNDQVETFAKYPNLYSLDLYDGPALENDPSLCMTLDTSNKTNTYTTCNNTNVVDNKNNNTTIDTNVNYSTYNGTMHPTTMPANNNNIATIYNNNTNNNTNSNTNNVTTKSINKTTITNNTAYADNANNTNNTTTRTNTDNKNNTSEHAITSETSTNLIHPQIQNSSTVTKTSHAILALLICLSTFKRP